MEQHADYDGAGLTWGLEWKKASAAQCCQACKEVRRTLGCAAPAAASQHNMPAFVELPQLPQVPQVPQVLLLRWHAGHNAAGEALHCLMPGLNCPLFASLKTALMFWLWPTLNGGDPSVPLLPAVCADQWGALRRVGECRLHGDVPLTCRPFVEALCCNGPIPVAPMDQGPIAYLL